MRLYFVIALAFATNLPMTARGEGACLAFEQKAPQIRSLDDFGRAMTDGMLLSHDQGDLFNIYRSSYFGDPKVSVDNYTLQSVTKILQEHPELRKPIFREYEIQEIQKIYSPPPSLTEFINGQIRSAGKVRSNLFQIEANIGFWRKLLALTETPVPQGGNRDAAKVIGHKNNERLKKQIAVLFNAEHRVALLDPKIDYLDKITLLYEKLSRVHAWKLKRQQDVSIVAQAIVDLVHTAGFNNASTVELLKSDSGLDRIEGFKKVLDERDAIAMRFGFEGHFEELLKHYRVDHPTGSSKNENYTERLTRLEAETRLQPSFEKLGQVGRIRPLSIQEAPFRSCLGGSDCSTRTYFSKALDPNYIYFTRTETDHTSSGHVTFVLGRAMTSTNTPVAVAFIDKIQNISNKELPGFLEAVRRSVFEKGYYLALPADAGDHNGLSNMETTRSFVTTVLLPKTTTHLTAFKPNPHEYRFENAYSRADQKLDVMLLSPLESANGLRLKPGSTKAKWSAPPDLKAQSLVQDIVDLQHSIREEDQLRYIAARSVFQNKYLGLDGREYWRTLDSMIANPQLSLNVRKHAYFAVLLKDIDVNIYRRLQTLSQLPGVLQQQIRSEILQWKTTSHHERKMAYEMLHQTFRSATDEDLLRPQSLAEVIRIFGMKSDSEGSSFLSDAAVAFAKNNSLFGYLLGEKDVDVNAFDKNGRTALHQAISTGSTEKIKMLLADPRTDLTLKTKPKLTTSHSARPSDSDGFRPVSPLELALLAGEESATLRLLEEPRIEIEKKPADQERLLKYAFRKSNNVVAAVMRRMRAPSKNVIPMAADEAVSLKSILAENANDPSFQVLILSAAFDGNISQAFRATTEFSEAEMKTYASLMRETIAKQEHRATQNKDKSKKFNIENWPTELSLAFMSSKIDYNEVKLIIAFADRILEFKKNPETFLLWMKEALRQSHLAIVEALLELSPGAAILLNNEKMDLSPIHVFAYPPILKVLLQNGFNVNRKFNGRPLLIEAMFNGKAEAVETILNTPNLDINAQDSVKNTALHIAVLNFLRWVKPILAHPDLNPNVRSASGSTPLLLAVLSHQFEVVSQLMALKRTDPTLRDYSGGSIAAHLKTIKSDRPEAYKHLVDALKRPFYLRWFDKLREAVRR